MTGIIATDLILKINPLHSLAITLKYIALYKSKNFTSSLTTLEYLVNNFDEKEIEELKKIINQYNSPSSIVQVKFMTKQPPAEAGGFKSCGLKVQLHHGEPSDLFTAPM